MISPDIALALSYMLVGAAILALGICVYEEFWVTAKRIKITTASPPPYVPGTPEPTEETIWHAARLIHDTDDITMTVWPDFEGDDGRRVFEDGDVGHLRLCDEQDIESFKAAARAAIQVYRNQWKSS